MSRPPVHLHPIAVLEDRYGGCYSRGGWLAIANADEKVGAAGLSRIDWIMGSDGPSGCDLTAAGFWVKPPSWISVGASPDEAVEALVALDVKTRGNRLLDAP